MAITSSDIVLRLSTKSGSAGDTLTSTAANSLGKYVSTSAMGTGAGALFDDISGAENAALTVDYRCFFVLNNHATLTLQTAKVYLSAEVSGGATITIAVDDIAASAKGGSSAQAAQIADETTAPTGTGAFSGPTSTGTALSLGDIAAGQVKAVWVKRTAGGGAAVDSDGVTFAVFGDTAA